MSEVVILMLNPSVDLMLGFDGFEKSKTNRVIKEIKTLGGKGLNVSFVAASFGLDVCLTGFIGKDKQKELSLILKEKNIKDKMIATDGKTRTNLKLLDMRENSVTEANGQGFSVSREDISNLFGVLKEELECAKYLVLTGSIPKGVDDDIYARCIDVANEKGVKVILDASGDALKLAALKKPYAIKPNKDELCQFFGRELKSEEEIKEATKELIDSGIQIAVVSLGKDGAMVFGSGKVLKAKTFDIDVKSTVGAGDSMVAAMCYGLANDIEIEKMARYSIAAGCITTSKNATDLCTAEEVFANGDKVEVLEVEI